MIPIIEKRKISFTVSAILCTLSLIALVVFGLKPGIDFTGGSLLQVEFTGERPSNAAVQEALQPLDLGTITVQPAEEKELILRTRYISEEEHQKVLSTMRETFEQSGGENVAENRVIEKRVETIGPSVSSQLRKQAWQIGVLVILTIVVFMAYAFRKVTRPVQSWKYGVTAVVALVHDIVITMGVFALLGHFLNVEIDISFIVALLTILGYSVNDTIVVFDRIRENLIRHGGGSFEATVNKGVNETIIRSLNTSLTTLLVLFSLFFFGGETIKYFSLALIIGISVGTYSSIFLASPLLVEWHKYSQKRA